MSEEKIWLDSYPPGVPSTVNCEVFHTLSEALLSYCKLYDEKVAFSGVGGDLTYAELEEKSRFLAASFQNDGLKKGDAIALIMPNILQFPITFLAALRIGLRIVSVNPMYTPRELTHHLSDAGVKAVVVLDVCVEAFVQSAKDLSVEHLYLVSAGDMCSWSTRGAVNFFSRLKKKCSIAGLPQSIRVNSFRACITERKAVKLKPVVLLDDDVILLQYTSATSGLAKGAMLTNKNILANMMQSLTWLKSAISVGEETVLAALPLYHIFSMTVCQLCFMAIGSRVLLVPDPRNLKSLIRTISRVPITAFVGLNTLFQALLSQPRFSYANFSQLKITVAGGMPTLQSVANEWKKVTGVVVLDGYGLTEASPIVTINPVTTRDFTGSVGLPIPNTEIKIIDANGVGLPVGRVGELLVRGPQVMKGYWNNPGATAEVLLGDGWLKTGDMARMDDQGFMYIVDRKKDMILVSGFNVYPNEIEDVLVGHKNIAEAAVVGVKNDQAAESVLACVVLVPGTTVSSSELETYCRANLAAYKIPREFRVVDGLPKSNVGKVLRRELNH